MGKVVLRCLVDVDDPVVKALRALLLELLGDVCCLTSEGMATLQTVCCEVGCDFQPRLCSPVFCAAAVVLWLAVHRDRFLHLQTAAGAAGTQNGP